MPSASSADQLRVYFAYSNKEVKIGVSANPQKRIRDMRVVRPDIKLLGDISGGRRLEKQLHQHFSEFRISGEWFRFTEEAERGITELLNYAPPLIRRLLPLPPYDPHRKPFARRRIIEQRYSVSGRTLDSWMKSRRIPFLKVGRILLFDIRKCDEALF
jgi:hypothetical protein